ncbi:MAG: molybdenum ABC transporter ATP-binding protein [Bryobacterales bacterium]|nr:molybdenum ABC transporter ATP-binding protein [Bryobacterales bacterium]
MPGRLAVAGRVWQDDAAGTFLPTCQRSVGYVFQEPSLFPHLSVRGNLRYGLRRSARAGSAQAVQFGEVVELLGLASLLDRSPSALSGGERQRVAVGRSLLAQPRLLLMDEPLAGLDQAAKEEILPYIETLQEQLALPVLYVSHDLREVARLASSMIVLSAGRNVCNGPVHEILERLDLDPGGAEFETGVILQARVSGHDARFHMTSLDHHGQRIVIPRIDLAVGERVRLRIRARDVALAVAKPAAISVRNILAGTVLEARQDPDTAYAEVLVDVGGGRLRARITRDALQDLGLVAGAPVYALVKSISFDRPVIGRGARDSRAGGAVS